MKKLLFALMGCVCALSVAGAADVVVNPEVPFEVAGADLVAGGLTPEGVDDIIDVMFGYYHQDFDSNRNVFRLSLYDLTGIYLEAGLGTEQQAIDYAVAVLKNAENRKASADYIKMSKEYEIQIAAVNEYSAGINGMERAKRNFDFDYQKSLKDKYCKGADLLFSSSPEFVRCGKVNLLRNALEFEYYELTRPMYGEVNVSYPVVQDLGNGQYLVKVTVGYDL